MKVSNQIWWNISQYIIFNQIYNILEELAFRYELKGKKFEQKEVDEALEWFSLHFFED